MPVSHFGEGGRPRHTERAHCGSATASTAVKVASIITRDFAFTVDAHRYLNWAWSCTLQLRAMQGERVGRGVD